MRLIWLISHNEEAFEVWGHGSTSIIISNLICGETRAPTNTMARSRASFRCVPATSILPACFLVRDACKLDALMFQSSVSLSTASKTATVFNREEYVVASTSQYSSISTSKRFGFSCLHCAAYCCSHNTFHPAFTTSRFVPIARNMWRALQKVPIFK